MFYVFLGNRPPDPSYNTMSKTLVALRKLRCRLVFSLLGRPGEARKPIVGVDVGDLPLPCKATEGESNSKVSLNYLESM